MPWVYDNESSDTFMVYDEAEPDTAPAICRDVRNVEHAKLIVSAPALLAFVRELAIGKNATTRDLPPSIVRDAKALLTEATQS